MCYLEAEAKLAAYWNGLDGRLKKAFWLAFAAINLAFLFHTVNFMFGDHDWTYVRGAVAWNEGAFEGRPLHFLLQSALFGGSVLPLLNNLAAFAALALGGILLARYWRLPLTTFNYTLFAVFIGILPYTLVWLYYAKDTLINLSLPLICIAGAATAEAAVSARKPWLHLVAVALLFWAFASYAAVVNLIGIILLSGILLAYVYQKAALWAAVKQKLPAVADAMVALALYLLALKTAALTSEYNTKAIGLDYLPQKLAETLGAMLAQFTTPLPFMEYKFKLLLLLLTLAGVALLLFYGGKRRFVPVVALLFAILFCSKFAYFIADERGQILAEMENFAFVPRLDFYGLAYVYALALACILSAPAGKFRKAAVILAIVIAFMSLVRDMYAQKVWKLGFDAEMKAHERIVSRLEQYPGFNPARKYRLLQIGSLSLRQNYYRKSTGEETSLDLLETSYTPEFMSRIVYNFYYPEDVFYANATASELSRQGQDFVRDKAAPWPSPDSIYIDNDIVVIVLTETALQKARSLLYY